MTIKKPSAVDLCWETLRVQASLVWTTLNAKLNIGLLGASIYLTYTTTNIWWCLLQPFAVFFCNISERFFGVTIWSREDSSIIVYNSIQFMTRDPYGAGLDLGFNYYNGDYTKTAQQAQVRTIQY